MPQMTQDLINQYVSDIKNIYGNHIKRIILYGSYARGDFHKDSDIDIMVLVDLSDTQIESYSDALSELGFESFYSNVVNEGVMLYEAV